MNYYETILDDIGNIDGLARSLGKENTLFISVVKKYPYPSEVRDIIIEDANLVINIINFYKNHIECSNDRDENFFKIRRKIQNKTLVNDTNDINKSKYNRFHSVLYNHLNNEEWFKDYYEETYGKIPDEHISLEITEDLETQLSNFEWRENQLEQIQIKQDNGIQTGIHCQATGTGKSYLIINDIDYLHRCVNGQCKIILFTERVNILRDLFGFEKNKTNRDLLMTWKNKGIGDLTDFLIINRVTEKTYDWVDIMNNHEGPCLVVINRAFLVSRKSKHEEIDHLDAIIFDECHSSTSPTCHNFLRFWKEKGTPIVGYSATPLRAGKTDGQFNKELLLEIFACPDNETKLNLITNYNMLYSIKNGLILPPKFIWYEMNVIESKANISQNNYVIVLSLLNKVMEMVQNGKIIAWCGTIKMSEDWYNIFNEHKNNHSDVQNIRTFIDHSKKYEDYKAFREITHDAIMFCAQKHREGSDISKLDVAIFLDRVKNRSPVVFIQSIGRVLRLDPDDPEKDYGVVIEGIFRNSSNHDKEFIHKILGYYFALQNISDIDGDDCYEKYGKIMDMIKFDKSKKIINMEFEGLVIPIKYETLEWYNVMKNFQHIIMEKVKMTPKQMFTIIIEKLKKLRPFQNPNSDFWAEYEALDHEKLAIPEDIWEEYWDFFQERTWYDLLGYKSIFHSLDELREIIYSEYPDIEIMDEKTYIKLRTKHNLVCHPFEYYRLESISDYSQLL